MTLDVRSATILLECARGGSLGRAAATLNITQPAVTRALKQLEESYGVPLFERTTRGVVPTVYGEALLPYAQLVVSEIGNAADIIRQMRGASRGIVRVGGVASVVGGFMTSAIAEMRRQYPDVQFQIAEELEDRLLEGLKAGEIDLAISPEPYADDEIALAMPDTHSDVVSVYARSSHPLAGAGEVSLPQVAQQDWALPPPGTPIVREWLRRFHNHAIEPRMPTVISRSVQVIKSIVAADDMLCWMPLPLVEAEVRKAEMVRIPVAELEWTRTFRIYRRKKGLMPPSTSILVQTIRRLGQGAGQQWTSS
jgi:DNA-binding transcriptional LysR family regulator